MADEPRDAVSAPEHEGIRSVFRFSILSLLAAMALVALALWPVPWLGRLYVANLLASLLLLGSVALPLWKRSTFGAVVACVICFFVPIVQIFGGVFLSPAYFMQVLLVGVVAILTYSRADQWRLRVGLCFLVTVATYAYTLYHVGLNDQRYAELLDEFPMRSIADRMSGLRPQVEPASLSEDQHSRLNEWESDSPLRHSTRSLDLQRLHSKNYRRFATATGFGVTRMVYPPGDRDWYVAPPKADRAMPFDLELVRSGSYQTLHDRSAFSFLDPDRIGYVQSYQNAAGFEGHAFIEEPEGVTPEEGDSSDSQSSRLRVERLELVSLLKHETPVAYVSDSLPDMQELKDAPTRQLDDFELAALEKLRGPSDLEVDERGRRVRMLGAIRAIESCADCHDAPRGALLGAFSYELTQID